VELGMIPSHRPVQRDPIIAYVFYRTGLSRPIRWTNESCACFRPVPLGNTELSTQLGKKRVSGPL
jgi:hypothetical protein